MSKSNKLLLKLIKASGGWENFLYETLKEVCEEIDPTDVGASLDDVVGDALEVIEAYEEQRCDVRVMIDPIGLDMISKSVDLQVKADKLVSRPVDEVTKPDVKKAASVPPPPSKPRELKVRVAIDTDAGWCQGTAPLPDNYTIVNKDLLTVSTLSGIVMARGDKDGQVKSQDVSGQVSSKGKYRLVFKDTQLGNAYINFEVMPIPEAPAAPKPVVTDQKETKQITPAMVAARDAGRKSARAATQAATEAVAEVAAKATPVDPSRNADGSNVKQAG